MQRSTHQADAIHTPHTIAIAEVGTTPAGPRFGGDDHMATCRRVINTSPGVQPQPTTENASPVVSHTAASACHESPRGPPDAALMIPSTTPTSLGGPTATAVQNAVPHTPAAMPAVIQVPTPAAPAVLLDSVQAAVHHAMDTCPSSLSSLWSVFPFQREALEYAEECERRGTMPGRAWKRAQAAAAKAAAAPPPPPPVQPPAAHHECWPADGSQAPLSLEQLMCSAQPLQLLQGGAVAVERAGAEGGRGGASEGPLFDMGPTQYESLLQWPEQDAVTSGHFAKNVVDTATSGQSSRPTTRTTASSSVPPTTSSSDIPASSSSPPGARKRRRDDEPAAGSVWVVAQERVSHQGDRGTRHFVVTTLPALWDRYRCMQPRHVYEVWWERVCGATWWVEMGKCFRCACCATIVGASHTTDWQGQ